MANPAYTEVSELQMTIIIVSLKRNNNENQIIKKKKLPDSVIVKWIVARQGDHPTHGNRKRVKNLRTSIRPNTNLAQSIKVGLNVVNDAIERALEHGALYNENGQHDVGEDGRKVANLAQTLRTRAETCKDEHPRNGQTDDQMRLYAHHLVDAVTLVQNLIAKNKIY